MFWPHGFGNLLTLKSDFVSNHLSSIPHFSKFNLLDPFRGLVHL